MKIGRDVNKASLPLYLYTGAEELHVNGDVRYNIIQDRKNNRAGLYFIYTEDGSIIKYMVNTQ